MATVKYIVGETVVATATSNTDKIDSTVKNAAQYQVIRREEANYYTDNGYQDVEVLLTTGGGVTTPLKNLTYAQIVGGFNVVSIQAFDVETKRFSKTVVLNLEAVEAPKAESPQGKARYRVYATTGADVEYTFNYTIEPGGTATGELKVSNNGAKADNIVNYADVAPQFYNLQDCLGPWAITVTITAKINLGGNSVYTKVITNAKWTFDIVDSGGTKVTTNWTLV